MSTREERIRVFNDTSAWIEEDRELAASISIAKKKTKVYYEDDYPVFDASKPQETVVTVTGNRSFEAAMKLHKEDPDAKIAVMNFANAFEPGGGVKSGSSAQEECLCRTSTLYPLLYRKTLRKDFYDYHKCRYNAKASDTLIYIEGVIICKTDTDLPERMPKEDWVTVDVITVAAPDLRKEESIHAKIVGKGIDMSDVELFGYHVKRAIHVLTCAAASGADTLVLGAFGCGAFNNKNAVVARAYKTAIEEFPKVFKKIEFAIIKGGEKDNFGVFSRVLGKKEPTGKKFESLTTYIPKIENTSEYVDKEKQLPVPFVFYSEECRALEKAIYEFVQNNPEYNLKAYGEIIEEHGIDKANVPLNEVDVSDMDETGVLALLVATVRNERFCDGFYLSMLENGAVLRWLKRLEEIDKDN